MSKIATTNPYDGRPIAEYAYHSVEDLSTAVRTAEATYRQWRRTPHRERAERLMALAARLEQQAPALAELASVEMGKPLAQAVAEVQKSAGACRFYAAESAGRLAPIPVATGARKAYIAHEPIGAVLCIMPWNFPYWQVIRFAVPAVAAGNTVLLKHAENTTGVALAIERLWLEAGFPPGSLQTILADHPDIPRLIADPAVKAVSLTGSERAGRSVAATAGANLKKTVLELGGSDAYVILRDADLEAAADVCVRARLVNSGQSCVAAKRFIIEAPVYEAFAEAFVARARREVVGHPLDPSTTVGPLAKPAILVSVVDQVDASLSRGARLLLGGGRSRGPGNYYPVTVLGNVEPGMPAFDEEVFGPAAALVRARDEEDALRLANASRFGLGGAIFSRDLERAERLARHELEAGFAVVNGMVQSDPRLPFGGVKASGYGRELSTVGLHEFVNVKTVVVS